MTRNLIPGLDAARLLLAASDTQQKPSPPAAFRPWCLTETFCLTNSINPEIASVLAMTHPSLITRQQVIEEIPDLCSLPQLPRSSTFPPQQPSPRTATAFTFPTPPLPLLRDLWLCITTLQLGCTPRHIQSYAMRRCECRNKSYSMSLRG